MIGDFAKPILMGHYKECNSRHVSHQTLTNSKNQIMTFYMAFFVPSANVLFSRKDDFCFYDLWFYFFYFVLFNYSKFLVICT